MDERRRRYYLTALGIDPWCARWPLPGGAPSPERPPEPVDAEPAGPAKPAVSWRRDPAPGPATGVSGQRASLDAVRNALDAGETAEVPAADNVEASQPTPAAARALNAMIWHDDQFSLIASVAPGLPAEHQNRLGRNILRALGASGAADAMMFRWPPFDNPELPGNNGDNFQRVLEQVKAGSASGRWVILGSEVNGMVGESLASANHEIVLAAEQTLGDLLAEPSAKRALWQRMQSLIHHGTNN